MAVINWLNNTHIEVCSSPGTYCTELEKVTMADMLRKVRDDNVPSSKANKEKCRLMCSFVKSDRARTENNVLYSECIALDIDDGRLSLDEFLEENYLTNVNYLAWETASSTPEHPKYRILLPIDRVDFTEISYKAWKRAINSRFPRQDTNASWFFTPFRDSKMKYQKCKRNLDISTIKSAARKIEERDTMTAILSSTLRRDALDNDSATVDTALRLPSVKQYVNAVEGERNTTANRAVFAMRKLGFSTLVISEVLDLGCLPDNEKRAFLKRKYC